MTRERPRPLRSHPWSLAAACLVVLGAGPRGRQDVRGAAARRRPASATLHVTPGCAGDALDIRADQHDTTALRVVADGRLLTLDVTPDPDDDDDEKKPAARSRRSTRTDPLRAARGRPTDDGRRGRDRAGALGDLRRGVRPSLYCFDGTRGRGARSRGARRRTPGMARTADARAGQTGITPRFRAGRSTFLWRASSSPHAMTLRVSRGSMTSSTSPQPATL
jgi:hypothetical protein